MQTITGLFDTYEHATPPCTRCTRPASRAPISACRQHARRLRQADDVGEGATTGAEVGAVLGAAGGLLAGLGIIAIPGLGPVVAGGWLFATAIGAVAGAGVGAATGGLVGALTDAGVPETDAPVSPKACAAAARSSRRASTRPMPAPAAAILRHAEGIDITQRRRDYEQEGWTGFDEDAPPLRDERPEARIAPLVPPVL